MAEQKLFHKVVSYFRDFFMCPKDRGTCVEARPT